MILNKTCQFCGRPLQGGKFKNYITCKVCKVKACKSCSKYDLCLKHYNELSDDQKQKIKTNFSRFFVFGIAFPTLILITILIFIMLFENGIIATPDMKIGIYTAIIILLLVIYIILMIILKEKKVRKIIKKKN